MQSKFLNMACLQLNTCAFNGALVSPSTYEDTPAIMR